MTVNTGKLLNACLRGKGLKGLKNVLPRSWRTFSRSHSNSATSASVIKSPFPDVDLPEDIALSHYMMEAMRSHGNKVGMVNGTTGEEWTFDKLLISVKRVASALSKAGVAKGDVVMLLSPNCPEFLITFLAVNACGAIISPLNPLYTPVEFGHTAKEANPKLVVTIPLLLPLVQAVKASIPSIQGIITFGPAEGCRPFSELLEDDGSAFPENINISPKSDLAALPFSSGTTGLPKGVMLSHYNLVSNLQQIKEPKIVGLDEEKTFLGCLPFFHIYGLTAIALLGTKLGSKVVTMPKFDPTAFLKLSQDYKVTHMLNVPPMVLFLAKHPLVDQFDLTSLKQMVVAAAPVSVDIAQQAADRIKAPNLLIRQGFGMTESSPITHMSQMDHVRFDSVGQPISNTLGKVVDVDTGEDLGANKEGELCMKGPQVMLGYLNNPEATAETIDSNGWLHSGDLGYYDEDGFFYITDRLKELIKYKGLQVAPAELETVLLRHPAVADVAVIGIPDERAGELPRAYIQKKDPNLTEEDIAQYLKDKVASYKQLAGGVEFTDEIPKSASGKILRRILKEQYVASNKLN